MSVQSREKIALAVFAALIVLSLCGLGWYLVAGHSWNVAASNIDDTFGSMDGYTAIVYAGTAALEDEADKAADAAKDAKDADAAAKGASETAPDGAEPSASTTLPVDPDEEAAAGSKKPATSSAGKGKLANGTASKDAKAPVTVDDAQKSYEDKKATVFSLDTVNIEQYREGTILKKGDHRFGVFSVTGPMTPYALKKQVEYFELHKVDFIVAVTADKAYVEGASGIDIVISTQDEDLFVMGETIDGTFYVDAPEIGKVGTILISPSNVVSAKVIEEL